jgi:hypothetical protein
VGTVFDGSTERQSGCLSVTSGGSPERFGVGQVRLAPLQNSGVFSVPIPLLPIIARPQSGAI